MIKDEATFQGQSFGNILETHHCVFIGRQMRLDMWRLMSKTDGCREYTHSMRMEIFKTHAFYSFLFKFHSVHKPHTRNLGLPPHFVTLHVRHPQTYPELCFNNLLEYFLPQSSWHIKI